MSSQLKVRNLKKTYRDATRELTVIESLTYDFPAKGSVAIVGRSGVGKSTLLHVLGGLDRSSEGELYFGDTNVQSLSDDQLSKFRGQHVGFVFQFHHLLAEFTALENVAMPLLIQGLAENRANEEAEVLLNRVGLGSRIEHFPGQLSGGEQQRVAIARALVAKPSLILADEPTGNLDLRTAGEVQSLLLEMNRDLENTLVVVTHDMELARSLDLVLEMLPGGALRPIQ